MSGIRLAHQSLATISIARIFSRLSSSANFTRKKFKGIVIGQAWASQLLTKPFLAPGSVVDGHVNLLLYEWKLTLFVLAPTSYPASVKVAFKAKLCGWLGNVILPNSSAIVEFEVKHVWTSRVARGINSIIGEQVNRPVQKENSDVVWKPLGSKVGMLDEADHGELLMLLLFHARKVARIVLNNSHFKAPEAEKAR